MKLKPSHEHKDRKQGETVFILYMDDSSLQYVCCEHHYYLSLQYIHQNKLILASVPVCLCGAAQQQTPAVRT